jgi:hypothetical protein
MGITQEYPIILDNGTFSCSINNFNFGLVRYRQDLDLRKVDSAVIQDTMATYNLARYLRSMRVCVFTAILRKQEM